MSQNNCGTPLNSNSNSSASDYGYTGYTEKDKYTYQNSNEPPTYHEAVDPTNGVPEDFQYGTTVENCDIKIRMSFLRKVYGILTVQLAITVGMCALFLFVEDVKIWVQANSWLVWVNFIPTILVLVALIFKRKSYPINFILLIVFTLLESYTIGVIVSFYEVQIVLEALGITTAIFVALTIFTLQTKFDFSGMGPPLFAALIGLLVLGIIQIFVQNEILEIIYCSIGIIIFSGLIIYDTYQMKKKLSPEEFIIAAITLYLDFLNLFLFVLRLLGRK